MLKEIQVKKLRADAHDLVRGSENAIGYDVCCVSATEGDDFGWELAPGQRIAIPTGLAVAVPPTHYLRVAGRSGLALKNGIDVLGGVVDADYRGEVKVILANTGDKPVCFVPGSRVAQFIFERADIPEDIHYVDELPPTKRGSGGFGSSGV